MIGAREVTVKAVKPSEVRKGVYYITVVDFIGELKIVGTRRYQIGDVIMIRRMNPVDYRFEIVKEAK